MNSVLCGDTHAGSSEDRNLTRYSVNYRAQTSLAFTQRLLCPFALGQIEDERDIAAT